MDNSFNHRAGQSISRSETKKMVDAFRAKNPNHIHAYYFGREHYERILALPGVAGIRTYHGLDDDGKHVHILVATDANGQSLAAPDTEQGQPCPPFCDTI